MHEELPEVFMSTPCWGAMPQWLLPDSMGVLLTMQSARVLRRAFHGHDEKTGEKELPDLVIESDDR